MSVFEYQNARSMEAGDDELLKRRVGGREALGVGSIPYRCARLIHFPPSIWPFRVDIIYSITCRSLDLLKISDAVFFVDLPAPKRKSLVFR